MPGSQGTVYMDACMHCACQHRSNERQMVSGACEHSDEMGFNIQVHRR